MPELFRYSRITATSIERSSKLNAVLHRNDHLPGIKDADRVQVLFVTVDPECDTPELLAKFVPSFDPSFLGLYGDAQATAQTAKSFGVSYEK